MTRTDEHRPSTILVSDYQYVVAVDTRPLSGAQPPYTPDFVRYVDQQRKLADQYRGLIVGDHRAFGTCNVCGTTLPRYMVVWKHTPSGGFITTGEDCADTINEQQADQARRAVRGLARAAADYGKKARAREAFLDSDPRAADAVAYLEAHGEESTFLSSLLGSWRTYGSLTEKQFAAVLRNIDEAPARAIKRAQRAEHDAIENDRRRASQYVGELGKRVELDVTMGWRYETDAKDYFGRDSRFYIYGMTDPDGNSLLWKTGVFIDMEKGDKLRVRGTVRSHNLREKDGITERQTELTRCRVVEAK